MDYYYVDCGGIRLFISFLYSETAEYFQGYITGPYKEPMGITVSLDENYLNENRWLVAEAENSRSFLEYKCLMLAAGNTLLQYNRAVFHSVAILWNDRAWLLTAPAGTGKTTQLQHWKRILKRDANIINVARQIIEVCEDNTIWVHSSPWRGKEHAGSPGMKVQLGGIILLQQGKDNRINRMTDQDAVIPLFAEFISYPENSEQIRKQAEILEHMLESVPVWKLVNVGNMDSTILTIDTIKQYMEGENG